MRADGGVKVIQTGDHVEDDEASFWRLGLGPASSSRLSFLALGDETSAGRKEEQQQPQHTSSTRGAQASSEPKAKFGSWLQ